MKDLTSLSLQTRRVYAWSRILNTPFWAIYTLLPFILCKDLRATPFEIACIISLKPIVSLFSLYWSSWVQKRGDRLIPNIVWATILGHLPFLLVPWVDHPWFFIFASAVYMLLHRGVHPAWMEILKAHVSEDMRKHVFAFGSAIYYVGGALLSIGIGILMDHYLEAWRWIFPLTALIALSAAFVQTNLPSPVLACEKGSDSLAFSLKEKIVKPWKEALFLLKERKDFAHFQIGFMLGGGGLMLWQPALPEFFFHTLELNYKELTFAITFCKSVGYTLSLPIWTRLMNKVDIFTFSGIVTVVAALFPLGLMAANLHFIWLYMAYFLYGIMQGGSELSWNLSGLIFAKEEDSSVYTGVNVVTIGVRGCIAPPLGSFLCNLTSAAMVLFVGGVFCLAATWQMLVTRDKRASARRRICPSET